jgi:hypothetical protein
VKIRGDIPMGGVILIPLILGRKSPTFGENKERHSSMGSDGHRGSMSDISSTLHQSEIPCSKWERLFRGRSKAFRHGER